MAEYKKLAKKYNLSGIELENAVAEITAKFGTKTIYQYEISGSTIKFYEYFDGTLPTMADFDDGSTDSYSGSLRDFKLREGYFRIRPVNRTSVSHYLIYPTFSSGTFSGTIFMDFDGNSDNDDDWTVSKLGTVSGTYTTSGTGISGCSITITFTSLPDGVSDFAINTAYELEQNYPYSNTYTKQ